MHSHPLYVCNCIRFVFDKLVNIFGLWAQISTCACICANYVMLIGNMDTARPIRKISKFTYVDLNRKWWLDLWTVQRLEKNQRVVRNENILKLSLFENRIVPLMTIVIAEISSASKIIGLSDVIVVTQ